MTQSIVVCPECGATWVIDVMTVGDRFYECRCGHVIQTQAAIRSHWFSTEHEDSHE